jgi:SAM-dependent methyltransferase
LKLPRPLENLRLSLGRRFLGRGKPKDAGWWNRAYAAGEWEGLHSEAEAARFGVVAGFLGRYRAKGSPILDVGCGSAPLYAALPAEAARCWVGTDLSAEAISRARSHVPEGTPLYNESAEGSVPGSVASHGPFGAILFSEVLYYLVDPVETLARYGTQLLAGGCFVISLWNPPRHRVLRWRISRRFDVVASETVAGGSNLPWLVLVVRPRLTGG